MKEIIRAQREIYSGHIHIHYAHAQQNGTWLAQPVVMTRIMNEGEYHEPFMTIPPETAQNLMDELWNCGLRPSEGTGSAGALAAVERHLADMQRLVFKGKQ